MYRDLKLTGTLILQSEDISKRKKQIPLARRRKRFNCNGVWCNNPKTLLSKD